MIENIKFSIFMKEATVMKDFISKLLNGVSIAIVCALIPNALLGEILKLIILLV